MYRDKIKQKNLNNVSTAKYDKTSIWFATLAISIVDDWAPDTIKIRLPRLIIAPHRSNFATNFCPYYQSAEKTGRRREVNNSWGHPLLAVAVAKRFKQDSMYELSAGTKKSSRCGEVAVSGGSTVLLYKQ